MSNIEDTPNTQSEHTDEPTLSTPYVRRRKQPSKLKPVALAVLIHLAVFGGMYAFLFYDKYQKPANAQTLAPATHDQTAPLATLSQADIDANNAANNEPGTAQNDTADSTQGTNAQNGNTQNPNAQNSNAQNANAQNINTPNPSSTNPLAQNLPSIPNGAKPQPPQQAPIIPDNQRTPVQAGVTVHTQTTYSAPPSEQGSSDPAINSRTNDGKALIAAINEADKENDALRETLERARQLNDAKIEQSRNRPHLSYGSNHIEQHQATPAQGLSSDDIPANEQ